MAVRQRDALMANFGTLRYEPIPKRVRAKLGDTTVIDSTRAILLWEPRRVVPQYAVPVADIRVPSQDAAPYDPATDAPEGFALPDVTQLPVLDPRIPFGVHTAEGHPVELRTDGHTGAGFRLTDAEVADYVSLDFDDFDEWYDEDDPIVGHPKDPFHRIDVHNSSRPVRLEIDGQVIAESTRTKFLFESLLPTRYYFPREDVVADLSPSETITYCAYKGRATYWSPMVDSPTGTDFGWSYEDPLHDAADVAGRIAFFTERADLFVDDQAVERPITPWSKR